MSLVWRFFLFLSSPDFCPLFRNFLVFLLLRRIFSTFFNGVQLTTVSLLLPKKEREENNGEKSRLPRILWHRFFPPFLPPLRPVFRRKKMWEIRILFSFCVYYSKGRGNNGGGFFLSRAGPGKYTAGRRPDLDF